MNTKTIAQIASIATKASQGLETCSRCTTGACCQNNKTLTIHKAEFKDRKHLFYKYKTQTEQAVKQYNETGLFTCPFFNHETNLCNEYENRFYTCAMFVVITPPENCTLDKDRTIVSKAQMTAQMTDKHLKLKKELLRIQKTPKVNLIDELKELYDN